MKLRRSSLVGVVLTALALLSPARADTPVNVDNFDNGYDRGLWMPYSEGTGVTLAEQNGRIEISFDPDASGSTFSAGLKTCPTSDTIDVQVDYQLLDWPANSGVRVVLGDSAGAVERVGFGASNDFPQSPREVYLADFGSVLGITATNDLSGKLKIEKSGGTAKGSYYDAGPDTWVTIASGTTSPGGHLRIQAHSHDYAFGDQPVRIAFDNFVVNSGQLACPTTLEIRPALADLIPGSNVYLKLWARLTDETTGKGIASKEIKFYADTPLTGPGAICTGTTDGNGVASCDAPLPLAATAYRGHYRAVFEGGTRYLPSSGEAPAARIYGTPVHNLPLP